jgi:hypothetical protein
MQNEEPSIEYLLNWGTEDLDFDDTVLASVARSHAEPSEGITYALAWAIEHPCNSADVVTFGDKSRERGESLISRSQRKRKIILSTEPGDGILNVMYLKKKFSGQIYNKEKKARWCDYKRNELEHILISYRGGPLKSIVDVAKENEGISIPAPTGASEPQLIRKKAQEGFCTRDALGFFLSAEKVLPIQPWTNLTSAIALLGGGRFVKITTHLGKSLCHRYSNFLQVVTPGKYIMEVELLNEAKHCFALTFTKETGKIFFDPEDGLQYPVLENLSEIGCKYIRKCYFVK